MAVSKKDALTQTLGKFRCSACKKRCKVTVSKYKAPEALTQDGWKPVAEVKPGEQTLAVVNVGSKVTVGKYKAPETITSFQLSATAGEELSGTITVGGITTAVKSGVLEVPVAN